MLELCRTCELARANDSGHVGPRADAGWQVSGLWWAGGPRRSLASIGGRGRALADEDGCRRAAMDGLKRQIATVELPRAGKRQAEGSGWLPLTLWLARVGDLSRSGGPSVGRCVNGQESGQTCSGQRAGRGRAMCDGGSERRDTQCGGDRLSLAGEGGRGQDSRGGRWVVWRAAGGSRCEARARVYCRVRVVLRRASVVCVRCCHEVCVSL